MRPRETANYDILRRNVRGGKYESTVQWDEFQHGANRTCTWRTSIQSKQRDKYETNEISKNVGGWSGLCDGGSDSAGATDHNNYHDSGPGNRYNNNSGDDNQQCRYDRDIHSGFGLLYVPNSAQCGAGALLLHERHGHCRSGRSHRKLVGHSARYAGNNLLHDSW